MTHQLSTVRETYVKETAISQHTQVCGSYIEIISAFLLALLPVLSLVEGHHSYIPILRKPLFYYSLCYHNSNGNQ